MRSRQNGRHFADDIFKCIFLNENVLIPITISLKFVPKGPINNIPALVQIMAWRRPGDKPLSEQMMVSLPTHICVARPQWVKDKFHIEFLYNFSECAAVSPATAYEIRSQKWRTNIIIQSKYLMNWIYLCILHTLHHAHVHILFGSSIKNAILQGAVNEILIRKADSISW